MRNTTINIIIAALLLISSSAIAQTVNWRSIDNDKNLVTINTGWDYGATAGLGYGYKLNTRIPLLLSGEYSLPFGNRPFDDFKTKLGLQAEVLRFDHFSATAKAYGIFRQYNSTYTKMDDFGSEVSIVAGYYKQKWFAAAEFGFDKAISTHIKNSVLLKEHYPDIQDGWYKRTGGNFTYGIQSGVSFKRNDLYIRAGKTITQDFKTTAQLPLYMQLGYNRKF
jgi:hypothetical protein